MNRSELKELVKNIMSEESEYHVFFKKALEKAGKSIPSMSDDEKKAFFDKIDATWDGKGEKNEALVGGQKKLDIDGDGEIESSDLAALRAGKKADEALKGNQHKLDVDGDGEIEASDLAALRAGKKADEAMELPSATLPSAIKSKLMMAIDKIKDSNLTYNQKIQVVGQVMDSLGIDKAEFNKMASKLKGTMESVTEAKVFVHNEKTGEKHEVLSGKGKGDLIIAMKALEKAAPSHMKYSIKESVNEGKKVFKVNPGIGKAKYSISSHDGKKTHKDGSDFYDIEIFNNKVDLEKGIKKYTSNGFVKESVNEAKYPTDLKVGSVIQGQGFTRLKGIDGGKYYKIVDMDDTTATLTRTDPSGKVSSPTKVRHKLDSIEAGIKTAKRGDENGIVVIKEYVNEGVSPKDMDAIKSAVQSASSFMGVGSELKKLGMKYTFATEPLPIYIIQPTPNNKVAIVNKKYATKPDFVHGDIAVGIMEGKLVNEGRAFINAARKAKNEGLTEFEFNGKKYPVTIKD
jgi:predicted transcriptional regulator of viral defense system